LDISTSVFRATPWIAYYADRFVKETQQLRPIEVAAYYRLFESYAQAGSLIDDDYMLRDIVRLDSEMTIIEGVTGVKPDYNAWVDFTTNLVRSLLNRFFVLAEDGVYRHPGWDKELSKAAKSYAARVKGAASANRRMGRGAASVDETTTLRSDSEMETEAIDTVN
jgi:uncharacterized protein YdaU (DUF1376 family)